MFLLLGYKVYIFIPDNKTASTLVGLLCLLTVFCDPEINLSME